jgi:hypothetical protein
MTPLTDAEVETKFRRLTSEFLEPTQRDALLRKAWTLDAVDDVRTLLELVAVKPSRREAAASSE